MIPGNRYRFTNAGTNVLSRISALATRKFSWGPYSTSPERSWCRLRRTKDLTSKTTGAGSR